MTDEELAEIEKVVNSFSDENLWAAAFQVKDIKALIAEVRRLKAEIVKANWCIEKLGGHPLT